MTPAPYARQEAQGLAHDGKLYVFGGFHNGLQGTARPDVYDLASDTWTRISDMPQPLTHSPVAEDGDTFWFVGGYVGDHPGGATRNVWKYHAPTDTWSAGPAVPEPRGAGALAVIGRNLHHFGGTDRPDGSTEDEDQGDHWVLNLDGGTTWTPKGPMPNPRNYLGGIGLNGKVYAIGGQHHENENTGNQAQVDVYDPTTDKCTRLADLPVARGHISASTFVRDGRILVIGGTLPGKKSAADVTSYDPATDTWVKLPSIPAPRKTPVAGLIHDTVVVATGNATTTTWTGEFAGRWETGPAAPVALGEVAGGPARPP